MTAGTPWGRLSFRASNQKTATGQSWRVDPFQLEGPDLKFSGRLNWVSRTGSAPRRMQEHMTALDFKLNSTQVGNLLTKLGFPDTMKRGSAQQLWVPEIKTDLGDFTINLSVLILSHYNADQYKVLLASDSQCGTLLIAGSKRSKTACPKV